MPEPTTQQILDTPMDDYGTVRGFLVALLDRLWDERDGFSGKRPFGDSGWEYDVYKALAAAGHVQVTLDEDGYVEDLPDDQQSRADRMIRDAIRSLNARVSADA